MAARSKTHLETEVKIKDLQEHVFKAYDCPYKGGKFDWQYRLPEVSGFRMARKV